MSEGPVLADGKPVGKGCVAAVITTDEAGRAATAPDCLPYGKYAVFELRADASAAVGDALNSTSGLGTSVLANSGGLLFSEQSAEVTISRNGEASELSFTDEIVRGGARISKQDRDLESGVPQGDASLEGIVFEVVNRSAVAVTVDGVSFEPGTAVMTVETGKDGTAETPAVLPFGTYEIREKATNGSYLLTDTEGRVFRIRVDGEIVDASKGNEFRNEVVRGGVSFQKVDAETGEASGFGHCTLAGAEITIYNDSESIVVVGGKEYPPGEAVLTLTTDEEGKCGTAADALPYGSYHAEETKAPEGYRINTEWRTEFLIRENGAVIDTAEDSVLREDRIPVEIHTSARDKLSGERTGAVAGADRVTIIDTVKMKGLLPGRTYTLTAELVGRDTGPEGSPAPVCPPVAQELTTPDDLSPEDEWSVDVEIEADGSAVCGRTVVVFETLGYGGTELASHEDLNDAEQTVRYQEPSVRTNAADGRTKSHEGIAAGENVTITDEVVMTGLIAGKEYTLRGKLADRNAGAPEEPVFIGDEVSKVFTAPEGIRPDEPFKVVMAFSIPEQLLRGRTVVVFESLCSGAQEIAAHADLSDEAQAVSYCSPQVRTTALDRDSKEHIGYTDGMSITICDTVRITGLAGGEEYTVIGRLIDASASSDGKTVYIDGAEETVTFRTGEGESEKTLEMTFTVDADKAVGRKVVVSETLMISDYVLAVHEDLSDEDQTVEYPEPAIRTSASAGDGSKELSPDEDGAGVIVDRVIIENIRPGTEVTAKGMLVDKKTGEPLTDEEGNAYESETTTVIKDASYSVDAIFEVEGLERFARMDIVVFEKLFLAGTDKLLAVHEDLEDEAQTVHVPLPPDVPETGDRAEPLLYAGVMITVLMCGVLILIRRRSG